MSETKPQVIIILKDPAWDNQKPSNSHAFAKTYLTDGSQELLEVVADKGLVFMQKNLVYDSEYQWFYWTYTGKGSFLDTWVTPDLLSDTRAFDAFKTWLISIVTNWAKVNNLSLVIEKDKPLQYSLKFIMTLPTVTVNAATT
jgi:hypothetical protein